MTRTFLMNELKNSFRSIGVKVTFLGVLALCLYNTCKVAFSYNGVDVLTLPASAEIFILRIDTPANSILSMLYVFLIVFPFGFVNSTEKRLHRNLTTQVRTSVPKYYSIHLLCSFITTFVCFFVPFVLSLLLNMVIFPSDGIPLSSESFYTFNEGASITGDNVFQNSVSKGEPFVGLYINHPQLYNLLYAFFFSAFSGICGVFVNALSNFVRGWNVFLLVPIYALTWIQKKLDTVFSSGSTDSLYFNCCMTDYLMIRSFYGKSALYIIILTLVLLISSLILTRMAYRKEAVQ